MKSSPTDAPVTPAGLRIHATYQMMGDLTPAAWAQTVLGYAADTGRISAWHFKGARTLTWGIEEVHFWVEVTMSIWFAEREDRVVQATALLNSVVHDSDVEVVHIETRAA